MNQIQKQIEKCKQCITASDEYAPWADVKDMDARIYHAVMCRLCGEHKTKDEFDKQVSLLCEHTPLLKPQTHEKLKGTFYSVLDPVRSCAQVYYSYALADTPVDKCEKCGCTYPKGIEVFEHGTFVGDEFNLQENVEFTYCKEKST